MIEHDRLLDDSVRFSAMAAIAKQMNLTKEDLTILYFCVMGDLREDTDLDRVLKKVRLPQKSVNVDRHRVNIYLGLLKSRMKELDKYGILDLEVNEVMKKSRNGEYMTIFGIKVIPMIYYQFYDALDKHPDYVVGTMIGIRDALDIILEFLGVDDP